MNTAIARNVRQDRHESGERPALVPDPPEGPRESIDARSFDPTQGRKIGSDPYDDPTHGRRLGSDPFDDVTQGRKMGGKSYDDPTQGRKIGSEPYDDPTQGRKIGSDPCDDPTRGRYSASGLIRRSERYRRRLRRR
jgi:hypothetical protein